MPTAAVVRATTSTVTTQPLGGGGDVTLSQVLAIRASFGFDQPVSECLVVVPVMPVGVAVGDGMTVKMGVSGGGNETTTRFKGQILERRYDLYPRAVTLVCKGPLWAAQSYENWDDPDGDGGLLLSSADFLNAATGTDQAIVKKVLDKVGVTYVAGNIGGTGVVWGTDNPDAFLWRAGYADLTALNDFSGPGQTALDYIQQIDAASAKVYAAGASGGFYRTFDSLSGTVYRTLIGGRPRAATDFTFTEGVDIFEGSATRSVMDLRNCVLVHGFDDGAGGAEHIEYGINDLQGDANTAANRHVYTFSSPLIEHSTQAEASTAGYGMDCQTVAQALLLEVNRETVTVEMTTPRDDLIGPGQTHLVQGPGGAADRLGTGERLWVQAVTVELDERGVFSQRIRYIGGGVDVDTGDSGDANLPAVGL